MLCICASFVLARLLGKHVELLYGISHLVLDLKGFPALDLRLCADDYKISRFKLVLERGIRRSDYSLCTVSLYRSSYLLLHRDAESVNYQPLRMTFL